MRKTMQNLVVLLEPSEDAFNISVKGAKMCLNRFCIDEDAAFESSGVYYLEKESEKLRRSKGREFDFKRKIKGRE